MKIFRAPLEGGKPPKIICTGCGKRAPEAGVAVKEEHVETGWGSGSGFDGPMTTFDEDDAHPLCEDCVTALERGEAASQ
jgi:hypothetical protein